MKALISIYPRPDLKRSDGKNSIMLRLTINRKRKYYSLGISVPDPAKFWDPVNRQIIKYPGANIKKLVEDNLDLENCWNRASRIILDAKNENRVISFDEFDRKFKASNDVSGSFYAFCDLEIERLKGLKKSSETIRSYKSYLSKIKQFRPALNFNEINQDLIKKYHVYMISLGNNENTCTKSLSFFRTMLKRASGAGLFNENVFSDYPLKRVPGHREFLTIDELGTLENLYYKKTLKRYQQNVLRYFLFSCFTGLRYQDMKDLRFKNVTVEKHDKQKVKMIHLSMHKTKGKVTIPVSKKAEKLLEEDGFLYQRIFRVNCNQVTNRYLKEIMDAAKIKKQITFHCARHTFATMMITMGSRIEVVSKLLGHGDIKTTSIYAAVTDQVKIQEINKLDTIKFKRKASKK